MTQYRNIKFSEKKNVYRVLLSKNLRYAAVYIFFITTIFSSNPVMTAIKRTQTLRTRSERTNTNERIPNAC